MEASLAAFFAAHDVKRWNPGSVDCCLALASWAIWLGHPDPAEHLRGAYDTEEGFRHIISSAGGVVPVVRRCVERIHGRRINLPQPGAIGVIGSPTVHQRQFGAIFDGSHWRVRFISGFGRMVAAPLAIWEI